MGVSRLFDSGNKTLDVGLLTVELSLVNGMPPARDLMPPRVETHDGDPERARND